MLILFQSVSRQHFLKFKLKIAIWYLYILFQNYLNDQNNIHFYIYLFIYSSFYYAFVLVSVNNNYTEFDIGTFLRD